MCCWMGPDVREPNPCDESPSARRRRLAATARARRKRPPRAVPLAGRRGRAEPSENPSPPTPAKPDPLIVLGEIRTSLVPDSTALTRGAVEELLALVPGRRVLWRERPSTLATSPTTAVGVDCQLATPSRTAVRAIGTVAVHGIVVGGRVLQSSARTTVIRAATDRRQTWSHYLTRVGVTEVITRVTAETGAELAAGFLAPGEPATDTLDLASISQRLLRQIRMDLRLDQHAPMQTETTRLRWAARIADVEVPKVVFRLEDEGVRTVLVTVRTEEELVAAQRFCEDLALHDWLLTVAGAVVDESDLYPPASVESAEILAPLLAHLVHLWMPAAHSPVLLRPLWRQLQVNPGFTSDWLARVGLLRDRMAVATLAAMRRSKLASQD